MRIASILFLALLLGACANERIVRQSNSYYKDLSGLAQQEVIDNIDATIDNPFRIPTRTTFGKGNLTFTDAGTASAAVPFRILSTNAGTATATVGSVSDAYQIALTPEVDGVALTALRDAYKAAVYPDKNKDLANTLNPLIHAKKRFVYWTDADGHPVAPEYAPPPHAVVVGHGRKYLIWTDDQEAFNRFILLTYGNTPDKDRVAAENSPVTRGFVPSKIPSRRLNSAPRRPIKQAGFNIPSKLNPTILKLSPGSNFPLFLGGKRDGGASNDPIAPTAPR